MRVSVYCHKNVCLGLSTIFLLSIVYVYYFANTSLFHLSKFPESQVSDKQLTADENISAERMTKPKVKSSLTNEFLLNPELHDSTVLVRTKTGWAREDNSCDGDTSFVKTVLHSPAGDTPIYTHPKAVDMWVSGSVLDGGMWESDMVTMFYNVFKADDKLQFLDIGGNIGIYGLTMGKLGRHVVLVEPMKSNIQKLCHSVRDGRMSDVFVIHNALSSARQRFAFGTYKGNVGGTYVKNATTEQGETVQGALLDDLLELFRFKKVAIKMDVETHEAKILEGGEQFFSRVDVRYVLLEFAPHIHKPDANDIIHFLARHGMKPFTPTSGKSLNPAANATWPRDVLWKKV